jgi:DNA topoisomerase-3
MKLIIAEKPDQGSTLASIFKNKKQNFSKRNFYKWSVRHVGNWAFMPVSEPRSL